MKTGDLHHQLAADARNLQQLKTLARDDPRAAIKGAAQQFEAFFMQMMLKSMRETLGQDGLFDSDQTRFYTGMLDEQMSQSLGSKGALGFAELLERQLAAGMPENSSASVPADGKFAPSESPVIANTSAKHSPPATAKDFVTSIWSHAGEASAATGIPAHLLVAHAALESGWGRSEPLHADGSPSFNLFGVKAGSSWKGDSVEVATTEYINGKPIATTARFRAYGSYREAFSDYAALIKSNPRFNGLQGVTNGTEFADSLQQSGYATDPMYSAKLLRIIQGNTLRNALLG